MKHNKTTRDYLNELLQIYNSICEMDLGDYEELIRLKKKYLVFNEKLNIYKILNGGLEDNEIEFLKNNKNIDFQNHYKELESMVWFHLVYGVIPDLMAGKKKLEYILEKINNLRLKFALNYLELPHFAYSPSEGRVLLNVETFSKKEIERRLKDSQQKLNKLKKELSKDRKLLRKEIGYIESIILPNLNKYKEEVERYFFEFKHLFKWYNKEIRIYISNIYGKDAYEISGYVYNSQANYLYVYPKELSLYSTLTFNIEEIDKEPELKFFTYFPKIDEKNHFKNSPSIIHPPSPFSESIEILWRLANKITRIEFTKKVFNLLGYNFEEYDKSLNIYKISKYKVNLEDSNTEKFVNDEFSFLLLFDKTYLNEDDVDSINNMIKTPNLKSMNNNKIYILADFDSFTRDKLLKNNIIGLSLRSISNKLIILNLFEYIIPYLKNAIISINTEELNSAVEKQKNGQKYINKLNSIETGHKTFKVFEDLMCSIIEFLFKDSFRTYYVEKQSSEYDRHRIRDLVISNISPITDFWKQRKVEQNAKRVIIDFKNYSKQITQETINDVSKYLNKKKGNFAIVISQKGIDKSGIEEQKLKYFDDDKLIIHIDKRDIVEMINYKIHNQIVEDILERKINEISIR